MHPSNHILSAKLWKTAATALLSGLATVCVAQGGRMQSHPSGGNMGGYRPAASSGFYGQRQGSAPNAASQRPATQRPAPGGATIGPQNNNARPRGVHLDQWLQQHQNMSLQDQQRALQKEPGFSQLPQQTQQRMAERLNRLNSMPEPQRERVIQRGEAMERLSPQQRVQVRSAMGQLSALPEDRRRMVARSFRDLRSMPQEQRNQMLNSPQYHQQFSDEERGTLSNLLNVSPLLPESH